MPRGLWANRKYAAVAFIIAIGFALGYVGTYRLMKGGGLLSVPPAPRVAPEAIPGGTGDGSRIDSSTKVTYRLIYAECGHEQITEGLAPAELIGLDREDLERMQWKWRVTGFEPGYVTLTRIQEGLCPEDETFRWIGIVDGYIAVFYGKPRPDAHLKERTNIKASTLYPEDRLRLERGVWVKGDQEVEAVLEGLLD